MDHTAASGFEDITHLLQEQQQRMERLEAENRELRHQLADLRRGIGIAVVIEGKNIALATEPDTIAPAAAVSQRLSVVGPPYTYQQQQMNDQRPVGAVVSGEPWKPQEGGRSAISDSFVL